ncbi:MAG: AraC-type DNA-binding protein [Herbinix sp.]|jgi:AraC-like DNA-binding protein|nr:AraC-type DNA-binding protein [Herbinix sp.]
MIDTSCQYWYHSLHIPVYIYDKNKTLLRCFPRQEKYLHPHSDYIDNFLNSDFNLSFIETKSFTYYGCIKSENKEHIVILGPVNPLPYTTELLSKLHERCNISPGNSENFDRFYCLIPAYDMDTFLATILLLNLLINQTELTKSDIHNISNAISYISLDSTLYKAVDLQSQEAEFKYNYEIEKELYYYVETGNIKKLQQFYDSLSYEKYQVSQTSNSYLRQRKNEFIIAVTSISRSAIKGGLLASNSYRLAELYIKQAEKLTDSASVDKLIIQASYDFTRRTAASMKSTEINTFIHQIQNYVSENIYQKLSVQNIAEAMNFNRSYLSHRFKIECGTDLNQYIFKSKIEESKNLLAFTEKPLSEISSLLGFSSQSHFQTKFKKFNNMTPQTYRNQCKRR